MNLTFEISEDEMPVFLGETEEQLQHLDEGLLTLEKKGGSDELLQVIFRAAHTLKGAAGMIDHNRMVSLTHALETAFDGLRKGNYSSTPELIEVCFDAVDALQLLRKEVVDGIESPVNIEELTDKITKFVLLHTPDTSEINQKEATVVGNQASVLLSEGGYIIKADIAQNSIASAARAFQIILALQDFGEIVQMDPDEAHIESAKPVKQFVVYLKAKASAEEINSALEDIEEVGNLHIEHIQAGAPISEDPSQEPTQELEKESSTTASGTKKPEQQKQAIQSRFATDKTVRTSVERLDNLMNLVGELITDRNRLQQIRSTLEARYRGNEEIETLNQTAAHINRITEELQAEVMGIRMVPIANVFNKFPRMVRDLATTLDKKVDLVIHGEDTELDRSIIELINDPLIHLIRNAIDHGVESPQERAKNGKPERASVLLEAQYEQGRIIITVEDDGKGIDHQKLRDKAVNKGFLTEAEANALSDDEALNLIFYSGFSTAKTVSNVSGRGVGLDIVRTNIQQLNGLLSVESRLEQGTRFQITLPLTLMIVQTLLVKVGEDRLAIPLASVNKSLIIRQSDINTVNGKPVIVFMEKVLPLLSITEVFNFAEDSISDKYVVVVTTGKQQMGLIVDSLLGEEEVVVKSLGPLIGEIGGISSGAILGDGRVILIIDVPDLFKLAGIRSFKH